MANTEHSNWQICVRAARLSGRARCGAGAGCSAIKYQTLPHIQVVAVGIVVQLIGAWRRLHRVSSLKLRPSNSVPGNSHLTDCFVGGSDHAPCAETRRRCRRPARAGFAPTPARALRTDSGDMDERMEIDGSVWSRNCYSRKATMKRELMAPTTDRSMRSPSGDEPCPCVST